MAFAEVIETIGKVIDGIGVAVIVVGVLGALIRTIARRRDDVDLFEFFRHRLARSILLSLEFLVAADIIRTVAISPTLESVAVLAGIVLIRTFLSFSMELEITGRWPWQAKPAVATAGDEGGR